LTFEGNFIDGAFVPGRTRFGVEDPAVEEIFTEVDGADAEQFDLAISAAQRSFDEGVWKRQSVEERAEVLLRMADSLERQRAELEESVIRETGSPTSLAQWAQVGMALDQARQLPELFKSLPEWEHNELPLDAYIGPSGRDTLVSVRQYEPCGVVAAISAYNFPMQTNVWKVFSALAAGCSIILRPSPLAPLTALAFGTAAADAGLPHGVLNVLVEEGSEGAVMLTSDSRVDCVSFTGSTAVGRRIAQQAAATVKRVCLELGGKSVQLYLPDAVDKVPMNVCMVHASLSGQACVAQARVLVPQQSLDQVVEACAAASTALVVGDPRDPSTVVGPLITASHRDRVEAHVSEGVAAGAKLAVGGRRPADLEKGYYFEPTVVVVEDNANPLAQREVFGPVVTIQGYRDVDHAVSIANDSEYGLSGGVYTADLRSGLGIARRIRTGTVQVNRSCSNGYTPAGGVKQSGLGRERGVAGFREFQEIKHIVLAPLD
jgi:acyl-CoA reductase-like NAD-dependent aldehyde dehydrogenase